MATPETHGIVDPGLAQPLARDPFQQELPLIPPDPSGFEPGDVVEIGNVCMDCGKARDYWILVPGLKSTEKTNGWALHQNRPCFCEMDADEARRQAVLTEMRPEWHDQRWLDDQFHQAPYRMSLLIDFRGFAPAALAAQLDAAERRARALHEGPGTGLRLIGPPDCGHTRLLAAYLAGARTHGQTAVLLSVQQLIDLTCPVLDEDESPRTRRNLKRLALRAVDHLGITGLFDYPMLPSEMKELALLLTYRTTNGAPPRATHVTLSRSLVKIKASCRNQPGLLAIAAQIETLTEEL